jgi:FAD synthase
LYDKSLQFATVKWLRAVEKFSGLKTLTEAIAADCEAARQALESKN